MAFDWSDLSSTTVQPDEVEVSFIGPGFGECIVVHVGSGRWITIDSCVDSQDTSDRRPVAERYLRSLGVSLEDQVDLVVATHWHDDHVRGLGRLVDVCKSARFSCANSMVRDEFLTYAEMMGSGSAATEGAKLKEFRHAISMVESRKQAVRFATAGKIINTWAASSLAHGETCNVRALSPSDREYQLFLTEIVASRPAPLQPKRSAPKRTPNLVSIVLQVEFESFSILLCADMESHHDPLRGWTAAVQEARTAHSRAAGIVKVAHHGSQNGHHDDVWTHLLLPHPIAVVSPFNKLSDARKLPKETDLQRLKDATHSLYLTASSKWRRDRARDPSVERSLIEANIEIRDLATPIGMVRCRRKPRSDWHTEVFPSALRVT